MDLRALGVDVGAVGAVRNAEEWNLVPRDCLDIVWEWIWVLSEGISVLCVVDPLRVLCVLCN